MYTVQFTLYMSSEKCKLYTAKSAVYSVHFTVSSEQCKAYFIVYNVLFVVDIFLYTVYFKQFTLYFTQCTVYVKQHIV